MQRDGNLPKGGIDVLHDSPLAVGCGQRPGALEETVGGAKFGIGSHLRFPVVSVAGEGLAQDSGCVPRLDHGVETVAVVIVIDLGQGNVSLAQEIGLNAETAQDEAIDHDFVLVMMFVVFILWRSRLFFLW